MSSALLQASLLWQPGALGSNGVLTYLGSLLLLPLLIMASGLMMMMQESLRLLSVGHDITRVSVVTATDDDWLEGAFGDCVVAAVVDDCSHDGVELVLSCQLLISLLLTSFTSQGNLGLHHKKF
ncbi:hypothetical protein PoB_001146400 [Plakobranchus ocellatus]|uniref:Odorant receptor n=1 Tax=Plakobranchus ocellatus TaxID=259542 RepID=A0AAV3YPK2_9GAST|nr:hypothetical protein PoB_001146400 [Plakobranchus ocellatus]